MTVDTVLINAAPGETRVALVAGDRLVEVWIDRPGQGGVAGDVYLGRVERVLPAIQAAFVDIGTERSGFLAAAEARPVGREGGGIADFVGEGDVVVVQAIGDPVGDKGARLTTRPTLPGRYLVATPGQADIRISRRIEDDDDRDRLLAEMEEIAAPDEGFILRTAAVRARRQDLARDVETLRGAWNDIEVLRGDAKAPARLYRELDPLRRILRDEAGPGLKRIVCDDADAFNAARRFCLDLAPEVADLLTADDGAEPLFEAHGVEAQIEVALAPMVRLPSGGRLIIEETAAATAVDVDSGGHTAGGPEEAALAVNLEAAAEIARQARLRNLAGHIVVDFVSMRQRHNGGQVVDALRRAVADDPTQTHVAGFTRLGLVEMTRQRRHASLADVVLARCPECAGSGRRKSPQTVALEALCRVQREAAANPAAALAVAAPPAVAEAFGGPLRDALAALEKRLGRAVAVEVDPGLTADRTEVRAVSGEERQ